MLYTLRLVFVLTTSPMDDSVFEHRDLYFHSYEACRSAMWWWIRNPEAELDGMDENFRLLIQPVPAWDCQPQAPLVG